MATFATRLKEQRLKHGMTQKDIAEKIGLSAQTVSLWERGARKPDWSTQMDLGLILEVSVSYLSGATDDDSPVKYQTAEDLNRQDIIDDDNELCQMAVRMCQLSAEMREMVKAVIRQAYRLDKENDRLCPEKDHEVKIRSSILDLHSGDNVHDNSNTERNT